MADERTIDICIPPLSPIDITGVCVNGRWLDPCEYSISGDGVVTLLVPELVSDDPAQPGWYAVLQCWDVEEGLFPGAYFWNGTEWDNEGLRLPSIQHWPIAFKSRQQAEDYAYEHDPDL